MNDNTTTQAAGAVVTYVRVSSDDQAQMTRLASLNKKPNAGLTPPVRIGLLVGCSLMLA